MSAPRSFESFLLSPIAHRGLHDRILGVIENSKTAFLAAMDRSYGIELDLQSTKDHVPLVFHDDEMSRLLGVPGLVRNEKADEICAMALLSGGGDHPLTFEALLDLVAGQVPLLVEIKDQSRAFLPELPAFLDEIIRLVRAYSGPLALMSFNPYYLPYLRQALANTPLGLVTDNFSSADWALDPGLALWLNRYDGLKNADFLSHNWRALELVQDVDLPKLCWTVRNKAEAQKALLVADNITFENYLPE